MRPDASKKIAAAAPKKGPNPVIIGAVIAALVIIAVVVAIVMGTSGKSGDNGGGSAQPAAVIGGKDGGILANAATAKDNAPTLDLYEDFQCPACAQLEAKIGAQKASLAKTGEIKLVVHTLSFLDDNLKNDSSKRSANAAACASDAGKFLEYRAAVFAAQPAQEGLGYTDAQLTQFAADSGIAGVALTTWQKCTSSGQYGQYVTDVQTASGKAGVNSTPTVMLNGKDVTKDVQTPEALVAAVKAATK
ncbi:MAG TPA: thioredoxin domain-containing protein [Dermatophilaceae bacterium]|nr:thioredoxin domain-containing protein [Dermatophilaceae bacterium]